MKVYAYVVVAALEVVLVPEGPTFEFVEVIFVEVLLVAEARTFVAERTFVVERTFVALHYEGVLNLRNVGGHHQGGHFDVHHPRHRLFRQPAGCENHPPAATIP